MITMEETSQCKWVLMLGSECIGDVGIVHSGEYGTRDSIFTAHVKVDNQAVQDAIKKLERLNAETETQDLLFPISIWDVPVAEREQGAFAFVKDKVQGMLQMVGDGYKVR